MEPIKKLKFKTEQKVGIQRMDDQHKLLFMLAREIQESLIQGWNPEKTQELFEQFMNETKSHFEDEEALMEKLRYADREEHMLLHRDLIRRAKEVEAQWKTGKLTVTPEVAAYVQNWFIMHVEGPDYKLGKFLRNHGLS